MVSGTDQKDAVFDIASLACQRSTNWDNNSPDAWLTLLNHAHQGTWVIEVGLPVLVPEISHALNEQGYLTDEAVEDGIGVILVRYPIVPTTRRFPR